MQWAIALLLAAAVFAVGFTKGMDWREGVEAKERLAEKKLQDADSLGQRRAGDVVSLRHARQLARVNDQLGSAREAIFSLPGRGCLDGRTTGVLNDIGSDVQGGAAAGKPASAASASATDRDVGTALATCRARYAEVNRRLTRKAIDDIIKRYGRRLGIPAEELHPHAMRHLFGTELTEHDVPSLAVAELMGHRDVKSTAIYTDLAMRKKAARLDQHGPLANIRTQVSDLLKRLDKPPAD